MKYSLKGKGLGGFRNEKTISSYMRHRNGNKQENDVSTLKLKHPQKKGEIDVRKRKQEKNQLVKQSKKVKTGDINLKQKKKHPVSSSSSSSESEESVSESETDQSEEGEEEAGVRGRPIGEVIIA